MASNCSEGIKLFITNTLLYPCIILGVIISPFPAIINRMWELFCNNLLFLKRFLRYLSLCNDSGSLKEKKLFYFLHSIYFPTLPHNYLLRNYRHYYSTVHEVQQISFLWEEKNPLQAVLWFDLHELLIYPPYCNSQNTSSYNEFHYHAA